MDQSIIDTISLPPVTLQPLPPSKPKKSRTRKRVKKVPAVNYLNYIEQKILEKYPKKAEIESKLRVGDIIRIGYLIPEGQKDRTQYYEGLIIAQNNRGLGKSLTLRRSVQGIGLEQVFVLHSPKIVSILKKTSSKVRRAKLYFIRNLRGKSARLKRKL